MASTKKLSIIKDEAAAREVPTHFIKAWRIARNFKTHSALADATKAHDPEGKGIPRVSILRLENGVTRPNQWHLKLLSNTLRVSQGDLLSTDPNNSGDIFSIYAALSAPKKKALQKFARTLQGKPKPR